MCGINGIIHLDGSEVKEASLLTMNQKMIHRGPDSEGLYRQNNIGLSMRRLSIIDLEGGKQPIFNEDKTVVVILNGEIYNYLELNEKLRSLGHDIKTKSDTECIVHLYEEYGEEFLQHLNGMFGLALFDIKNNKVIIARDRIGIKPLYFSQNDKSLKFSSDLNSLKEVTEEISIKKFSFLRYLGLSYILHPNTIFNKLKKLEPAHYISITNNKVEKKRYWELENRTDETINFHDAKAIALKQLSKAVRLRMRSDVPVGSFLSGGIDSSAIVALMAQENPKELHTFSVGFEGGENELSLARLVSKKYQTTHFEKLIKLEDVINIIPELIERMDEPIFDSAMIPSLILSKEAISKGVKVILNGTGGDEVFGGYTRYAPQGFKFKLLAKTPRGIRKILGTLLETIDPMRARLIKSPGLHFFSQIAHVDRPLLRRLIPQGIDELEKSLEDEYFDTVSSAKPKELMKLDLTHYLPGNILSLLDKTSMNVSLEGRTPFLDHNLIETCFSFSSKLLIQNGQLKSVLREAVRPLLPEEIFTQKKMGFAGPVHSWMTSGLFEKVIADLTIQPCLFLKENIQLDQLNKIQKKELTPTVSQLIFGLFIFNLWFKRHVDGVQIEF